MSPVATLVGAAGVPRALANPTLAPSTESENCIEKMPLGEAVDVSATVRRAGGAAVPMPTFPVL
ncbi:MAG TPA: hypothetical protein VLH56_18900 [Dissulfurispiraceae bacterium]|nr:hypothetical protein [Dissulfurispiraceae bacterium]